VSSDNVSPFGVDSIRVESGFMFVGMSRHDEGIVKVYNLSTGASHQLTGHKVGAENCLLNSMQLLLCCRLVLLIWLVAISPPPLSPCCD
jgi:hypothetical protein